MELANLCQKLRSNSGTAVSFFEHGAAVRKSFETLASDVERAAGRLTSWGVKPGMRVGILAPNSYRWLVYDLALISCRAVSVAFPDEFNSRPAEALGEQYGLNLLLTTAKTPAEAIGAAWAVHFADADASGKHAVSRPSDGADGRPPAILEEGEHSLVFSSGTAGRLKCMAVTRSGSDDMIKSFARDHGLGPSDSVLVFLPLSHYQQRLMVYGAIWYGCEIVLVEIIHLFKALKTLRPTVFIGPPIFYETIAAKIGALPLPARVALRAATGLASLLPSGPADWLVEKVTRKLRAELGGRLRVMITGMASIRKSTLKLMERLRLPVYEAYGVTESGLIAWNTPRGRRLGSVGRPVEEGSISLAADGEIIVRKRFPLTRGGFLFDETGNTTAATYLPSGEIATGDIGRFDKDGYLYITGRKKEIIVTQGGIKIHPEQIEAQLAECPNVDRAVVLGNELPFLVAIVVARQSGQPAEEKIQAYVKSLNARLTAASQIGRTIVTDTAFTIENGLLNRSMKVDRGAVTRKFQSAVGG